ncbi:Inaperturate pollen1 [Thalictrum thalictroides]|uniref:Inaperturate pollen1 n=1 Tax=Thalictrum thalictroides TaxID=46969 RepID=A0A7J6VU22_THATH|nr:Inaperturate pollen1 [Thalictrum thalictroides]
MMKAVAARIGLKRAERPFKDFYEEWIETLKTILLPLLRRSMLVSSANHLSTHVQMLHHHFQTYYYALDLAASEDISQLLYPTWRNSLEKPFLWFADFHPNLFINLLKSFLNQQDSEIIERNHEKGLKFKSLKFPFAWNNPSTNLLSRIEQIECGLRLMVPTFVIRARKAQEEFIKRVGVNWVHCEGKEEASKVIGGAVVANMEELVSVFLDANRLRRSILTEIMGATDAYQAALYLEGLANFFVGFKDCELLKEFEQYKIPI